MRVVCSQRDDGRDTPAARLSFHLVRITLGDERENHDSVGSLSPFVSPAAGTDVLL